MPTASSFVGRTHELYVLGERLSMAFTGQGSLVFVSGEAGIGKTSLVSMVCESARERGGLVLTGTCYDLSTTPPYGPWTSMFDQQGSEDGHRPAVNPLSLHTSHEHASGRGALFDEVVSFVGELSREQPLVLVLEDMHWSDPASLELLRYLGRRLPALSVLLIATYRSNELSRGHPLYQLLPVMVRETPAERIDLHALDDEAVHSLVAERYALPGVIERRLVKYLQQHAEGNPFFLNELLRTLESEHLLQHDAGGWQVHDLERAPVPPLVRQIIERRLGELDAETRLLLELAAVIAQVVPVSTWQAVSGATDAELLDAVERGMAAHLLAADADGSVVRFDHALTREALYEGIVPLRRRDWHRQIGEALLETPNPDPDAVAHHFLQAGDERAIPWTIQAANRAERSYAWVTASERFETTIRLMEGREDWARERGWLLHRLGMAMRWTNPELGIAYHDEASRVAEKIGDRSLLAISLASRGMLLSFTGRVDAGIAQMTAGAAELDAIPAAERRHLAGAVNPFSGTLTAWLGLVGRSNECIERGERFMAESQSAGEQPYTDQVTGVYDPGRWVVDQTGSSCTGLGHAYALVGQPKQALQAFAQASELFHAIAHHGMTSNVATYQLERVALPYFADDLAQRQGFAVVAEKFWGLAKGALPDDSSPRVRRIPLLFVEGRWDEARTLATDHPHAYSNVPMRVQGTVLLAAIARHQGDVDSAWRHVGEAFPYGPASEPGELEFLNAAGLQRVAVELALDSEDLPLALAWLEACDRWLDWSDAVLGRASVALLRARYHAVNGDWSEALQQAGDALTQASVPRQPLVLLAAHRFLGMLAVRNAHYDLAESHFDQAMALANACAAPFERALTLVERAELHIATGSHATARARIDEARTLCTPLSARPALDRLDRLEATLESAGNAAAIASVLSPRELEVLRLLVLGKTDRQIAEDLFISRHTVMRHVSNILNKFGVESRTAATAHAIRHSIV